MSLPKADVVAEEKDCFLRRTRGVHARIEVKGKRGERLVTGYVRRSRAGTANSRQRRKRKDNRRMDAAVHSRTVSGKPFNVVTSPDGPVPAFLPGDIECSPIEEQ